MVKIRIGDPTASLPRRGKTAGQADLPAKRVRAEDGKLVTIYTIDANSQTLGDDMLTLFRRNVTRARRANRTLIKKHGIAAE